MACAGRKNPRRSTGIFIFIRPPHAQTRKPMNPETLINIGWAVVFCLLGAVLGIALVMVAAAYVPRVLDKFTPNLDEGREIVRGNRAVAHYFGLVCGACILGLSIVVAAAVLGGILAALH